MGYIYKITNIITNKIYVGKTIKTIDERFREHISNGRKLQGTSLIAHSLREYGTINHKIEVIEECFDNILQREQYWIDELKTLHIGYNVKNEYTEDCRRYWGSEDIAKKNISGGKVWNTGIPPNNDVRRKISETKKIRGALGFYEGSYGHKHSDETKQKLSEMAKKRPPPTSETIEKFRQQSLDRICYYSIQEKKRIFLKRGSVVPEGYVKGKGAFWVTKDGESLCVDVWDCDRYINDGYIKGRCVCGRK